MIRKYSTVLIFTILSLNAIAQINRYGHPLIKNYPPDVTNGSEQNWSAVQDHRGIMYFGNDDEGILEYDGVEWRTIPLSNNSMARSFAVADDGTIYAGGSSEIGYLEPTVNGDLTYVSLKPILDSSYYWFRDVWKTYCQGDNVYFCSQQFLMTYSRSRHAITVDSLFNKHVLFTFLIDSTLYMGGFEAGLMMKSGNLIEPVPGGEYYRKKNIFGVVRYDKDRLAVAAGVHGLSLINPKTGEVDSLFAAGAANRYFSQTGTTDMKLTASGNLLVSTQNGGLVVVDRKGKIKEKITKDEGLQAQSVYYSFNETMDAPYPPTWSALNTGIAKTAISSPLRVFTEENGFLGLILTINSIGDRIFIGTSSGLYYLQVRDGVNTFTKVEQVNFRVWYLEKFNLDSGEEVLLGASDQGLIEIRRGGEARILDPYIENDGDNNEYWGYIVKRDPSDPSRVFVGRQARIAALRYTNGKWKEDHLFPNLGNEIRFIEFDSRGNLWFGTNLSGIGRLNPDDTLAKPVLYSTENGLPTLEENVVVNFGGMFRIGTSDGIYSYDLGNDSLVKDQWLNSFLPEGKNAIGRVYTDAEGDIWISLENSIKGWVILYLIPEENGYTAVIKPFSGFPNFETDAFFSLEKGKIWMSRSNLLYHFEKDHDLIGTDFRAIVRRMKIGNDSILFNGSYFTENESGKRIIQRQQDPEQIPEIRHSNNNSIEFRWSAPYFIQEENTLYSFYLKGFSEGWSDWDDVIYKDFTNLPHGNYVFSIKAKNIYGEESLIDSFSFVILRPWYLSFLAIIGYIVLSLVIIYVIIVLYTRRLKNENIRLEGIIQDRTAEIRKQKEELTDSIEYASRIQRALLPPEHMLDNHGIDHFILFKPRDIVSGDFYWFGVKDDTVFVVAADCTGHGVPGAFMSMLGISFLDEIVIKSGVKDTNRILDALRQHVITSLRQSGTSMTESTKDGMDLAMIAVDKVKRQAQFSGAYNPLYGVRKLTKEEKSKLDKGEELELDRGAMHSDTHLLFQVKGDQMPIGISEKDFEFSSRMIDYEGTTIYLFSDGYVDQFGGPSGKKFMSKNFKKLLLSIQHLGLDEQRAALERTLHEWMAEVDQIDDILVIGIRLS